MRYPGRLLMLGLAAGLVVVPATAAGQNAFYLGPMGGVSFAKFHGSDVGAQKTRTGFVGGGFAGLELGRYAAVELQAFYVQKGAKADVEGIDGSFKLDYVEIPLLLKGLYPIEGRIRVVPNLFIGPAVAFKAKCELEATSAGTTQSLSCSDAALDIKGTDFSAVFGGGVDIGPVAVQGRYDLGLVKILDVSGAPNTKTSAWIFTAGLRVPMRR